MFKEEVIMPMFGFLFEWSHHLATKTMLFITGMFSFLALELFQTPELWWKGLVYLVILDWVSGIVVSLRDGEFDKKLFPRKIYRATGYIIACSAVAIPANAMPIITPLYYFQFAWYLAFFVLEVYSIFRIWKFWAFTSAVYKLILSKESIEKRSKNFMGLVEEEHEKQKKK